MKRNRIKVVIPVAIAMLIALVLFGVSMVSAGAVSADTLDNTEMDKILGKCGCHTEDNDKGCDEGDDPPDECGGASCTAYNLAGANPNKCESRPPENDWHCEDEDDVTCKTPYTCNSEKKWMWKCEGAACTNGSILEWCAKCTCTAGTPQTLNSHYCDN